MEDYRKHVRDWIEEINVDIDVVKKKMGHLKYCVNKLPVHEPKPEPKKKTLGVYVTDDDFLSLGVKHFWVKDSEPFTTIAAAACCQTSKSIFALPA